MWNPYAPWPQGSFQNRVPIPTSAPGDSPTLCVAINAEWMPYLIGAAKQLMLPETWGDMRDPVVLAAQGAANELIGILAAALPCGADNVAGVYAGDCLQSNVALPGDALTDVLSLAVGPGEYQIVARVQVEAASDGTWFDARLWDGGSVLAAGESVVMYSTWGTTITLSAHVVISAATTYTIRVQTKYGSGSAVTDVTGYPTGAHVATCLEAIPLGISGPVGPLGPPGPAPSLRLTAGCILQSSGDGGISWADVPGWDAKAPGCFAGFGGAEIPISQIDPGNPPNPQGASVNQQACNIAAYLSSSVIKAAISKASSAIAANQSLLDFGVAIVALLPGVDLAFDALIGAGALIYQRMTAGTLSDYNDALADATLWSDITCAIYLAIRTDGEVTTGNFATLVSSVGAVTYVHADVITLIVDYLNTLGAAGLRNLQTVGTLDLADCSACGGTGAWCTWWETGTASDMCNGDWIGITGGATAAPSVCSGGVFQSVNNGAGGEYVVVQATLPAPRTLTTCRVDYSAGALDDFNITFYAADGTQIYQTGLTNWQAGTAGGPQANVSKIIVRKGSGNSSFYLGSIKVGGPDSGSPWGVSNGVCD